MFLGGGGCGGNADTQQRVLQPRRKTPLLLLRRKEEEKKKKKAEVEEPEQETPDYSCCQKHRLVASRLIVLPSTTSSATNDKEDASPLEQSPRLSPSSASTGSLSPWSTVSLVDNQKHHSNIKETLASVSDVVENLGSRCGDDSSVAPSDDHDRLLTDDVVYDSDQTVLLSTAASSNDLALHEAASWGQGRGDEPFALRRERDPNQPAVTGNHNIGAKSRPNRKRKFGVQQHLPPFPPPCQTKAPWRPLLEPMSVSSTTSTSRKQRDRLSKCFGTPHAFVNDVVDENRRDKNRKYKNKKAPQPENIFKRHMENHRTSHLLDFTHTGEQSEQDEQTTGKTISLISNEIGQPTSQTSLRKANAFFERLKHESLALENECPKAKGYNPDVEDLIGGLSSSPISSSPRARVASSTRVQGRTHRVLSLRDPGVARVYKMHLKVCQEAGVKSLSLEAFWNEQRKQLLQYSERRKSKILYDGFLDEN